MRVFSNNKLFLFFRQSSHVWNWRFVFQMKAFISLRCRWLSRNFRHRLTDLRSNGLLEFEKRKLHNIRLRPLEYHWISNRLNDPIFYRFFFEPCLFTWNMESKGTEDIMFNNIIYHRITSLLADGGWCSNDNLWFPSRQEDELTGYKTEELSHQPP